MNENDHEHDAPQGADGGGDPEASDIADLVGRDDDLLIPDALPDTGSSPGASAEEGAQPVGRPLIARHRPTIESMPMVAGNPVIGRALSAPHEASWDNSSAGGDGETIPVLCFMLGDSWYGLRTQYVRQVVSMPQIFAVPTTPAHILGVANLAGLVVPVMDIRRFLDISGGGLPKLPPLAASREVGERRMVIVEANDMTAGFPVDLAREVVELPDDDIRDPHVSVGRVREFAEGEVERSGRVLTLFDVPHLLESARC